MTLLPGEIVVDSFAGGGGASKGMELALGRGPDIAINHDAEAIALHAANHPDSEHYREDVWQVDPPKPAAAGRWGSCGSRPTASTSRRRRAGSRSVLAIAGSRGWRCAGRRRSAADHRARERRGIPDVGAGGAPTAPVPGAAGKTFRAFVAEARKLGYAVEWRELRACDYGAPTIRKRLFLVARCDGQAIKWPTPTHGKGRRCRGAPRRSASTSIRPARRSSLRKKPLAENTLKRIGAGLRRFVFESDRAVHRALSRRTGGLGVFDRRADADGHGQRNYIKRPGGAARWRSRSPPRHLPRGKHDSTPHRRSSRARLRRRMPAIAASWRRCSCRGTASARGRSRAAQSVEKPMPTIVPTQNGASLVAGFLAKHYGGHETPGTQPASADLDR
jgi:DNA (cytosine-5)-methyltransferase 1